jgi:hypothetical protein
VHAYKSKILPLLGDEKVADLLEEEVNDAEIYEYERLHDQPAGFVWTIISNAFARSLTFEQCKGPTQASPA